MRQLIVAAAIGLAACHDAGPLTQNEDWIVLLDTDLSHWDRYLSYRHVEGYDGNPPTDNQGNPTAPLGLNPSNTDIFTISLPDGEPVLRVSGEVYGAITTKQVYRNYHFQLKFKWGDEVHPPRRDLLKDSGILYHAQGPDGAEYWRSWKLSQEFQIMEGHLGDYWSQANSAIDVRAYPPEYIKSAAADLSQPFLSFGASQPFQGYVMRSRNLEIPGDWNQLDLICHEGRSLHIVNGEVVMALDGSRYMDGDVAVPLVEGQIQLQSEAAEIFFKDIRIRPLTDLPLEHRSIFEEQRRDR